jgi:hypothetical protein
MSSYSAESDKATGPHAHCLGQAVLKLRDAWAPFEREKPAPVPTIQPGAMGINAMMTGLTILAVLTFIAIGEIRRTQGPQPEGED